MKFIINIKNHNDFVKQCYLKRGFNEQESQDASIIAGRASYYGNQTHNALKALHLDDLFGSKVGGCIPQSKIEKIKNKFKASEVWNANKKLGQSVALEALKRCTQLADEFGIGMVSVDNAFHYLYGGAYVIDIAKKGYLVYTNCTSTLAEVVPWQGKNPTMGTNPHSWGFPTTDILGFPICIDWATSAIAMGRVQQLARENGTLPPNSAIDKNGEITQKPNEVHSLLPFGAHKGYGLSLINELYGAFIGGHSPSIRGRFPATEKNSCNFFFQVIHPDALSANFFNDKSQQENVKVIIDDILNKNPHSLLPGEIEYKNSLQSEELGGLVFTENEKISFDQLAKKNSLEPLNFIVQK